MAVDSLPGMMVSAVSFDGISARVSTRRPLRVVRCALMAIEETRAINTIAVVKMLCLCISIPGHFRHHITDRSVLLAVVDVGRCGCIRPLSDPVGFGVSYISTSRGEAARDKKRMRCVFVSVSMRCRRFQESE